MLNRLTFDRPTLHQHKTTAYLMLNNALGAGTGILFWLLIARWLGVPADEVGLGYATVALGTAVGLIAKGGLDTAVMRHVPEAEGREARRLVLFGVALGAVSATLLAAGLGLFSLATGAFAQLDGGSWLLVGAIAVLLVAVWLQDAFFLAQGDPAATFRRNLVFSVGRILLPVPVVLLLLPRMVPLSWALALLASAAAGLLLFRGQPLHPGRAIGRRRFVRSASRNVAGNAAEFLPGLLLVPLVLTVNGSAAAAYFGMAWTAASLLFLAAAAIGRSALSSMVKRGGSPAAHAVRRAGLQAGVLLAPGAVAGMLLAPVVLSLFGPDYAAAGAAPMIVLCASTVFIAPAYLYLAVLRAQERTLPLILFPALMIGAIFIAAPWLAVEFGLTGVALAWLLANAPFGMYATIQLGIIAKEVSGPVPASGAGHPHSE